VPQQVDAGMFSLLVRGDLSGLVCLCSCLLFPCRSRPLFGVGLFGPPGRCDCLKRPFVVGRPWRGEADPPACVAAAMDGKWGGMHGGRVGRARKGGGRRKESESEVG
jgi:hypothetical protein